MRLSECFSISGPRPHLGSTAPLEVHGAFVGRAGGLEQSLLVVNSTRKKNQSSIQENYGKVVSVFRWILSTGPLRVSITFNPPAKPLLTTFSRGSDNGNETRA